MSQFLYIYPLKDQNLLERIEKSKFFIMEETAQEFEMPVVLIKLLKFISREDVLMVRNISRLGNTTKQILLVLRILLSKNIELICLEDGLFDIRIFLKINEAIQKKDKAFTRHKMIGIRTSRKDIGGRPSKLTPELVQKIKEMYQSGIEIRDICQEVKLSNPTIIKALRS